MAGDRSASAAAGPRTWSEPWGWRWPWTSLPRSAGPRPSGWLPYGTGSATACSPRSRGHTAPLHPGSQSYLGTCTFVCPGWSGRSCWSDSAPRGSACPAVRRAPVGRSSPVTSSPPWGYRSLGQEVPFVSRSDTTPRRTTSTAPSPSCRRWRTLCAPPEPLAEVRMSERRWHTGPVRVMVAMSGGVDSSVAAALLVEQGHEVVGATLKLWGGESDSGCCSVADVEDARRVAQQLGITHHVFNLTEEFDRNVVAPYVGEHARGRTPNPCIECNRSLKFDRLLRRADRMGFDRLATGHHARVTGGDEDGRPMRLRRGADAAKDQSYVLSMLDQHALARVVFPVGEMTKDEVRARARRLGLRTASKPDSQDVCFIGRVEGRQSFLAERMALHP